MSKTRMTICLAVVCMMAAGNAASADTIRGINMEFVTIGRAGNAADIGGTPGCGAVGYNYRIGKYEVTNAQWNAFTGAAGTPTGTDAGYSYSSYGTGDQKPTTYVNWYEAAQFCNYLTSGDKSKGAYLFSGNNSNPGDFLAIDRDAAKAVYGTIYVIPGAGEWHKAAYCKPDGSSYSLYANGTDTPPVAEVDANYDWYGGHPWNVGSGTIEQNGTYDMMGNVWEWNESRYGGLPWPNPISYRGLRGGSLKDWDVRFLSSSYSNLQQAEDYEMPNTGFRIASIPEPCTLLLLGVGGMILRRKR